MKALKIRYLMLALILTLSLLFSSGCELMTTANPSSDGSSSATTATTSTSAIDPGWTAPGIDSDSELLVSIADVVALVKPSVVAINTEYVSYDMFNQPYEEEGAGSGWIIDEDGLIVTNNHVVEGATGVTVTLADGRTFSAVTILTDSLSDLAVVKINATNLAAVKVGDSAALRVGDWVVAIGNSLGLGISATKGIVSAQGVSLTVAEGQTMADLLQTDAAINPGNSGGPLVNMAGEVIGITSVKVSQVGVEGMGYAISSNSAIPIIEELIQNGYVVRPWMGVELYTVNQYVVMRYNLSVDEGAFVTQVTAGGPAEAAGIQAGDVITSIDDEAVTSADELIQAIHSREIGQTVNITYWRNNNQYITSVTLLESPPS